MSDEISFFLVKTEVYRIGDSEPAVKFNVSVEPNSWSKIVSQTDSTITVERVKLDVQNRQNQNLRALKQDSEFTIDTLFLSGNIADLLW
jgi:hypothetical protein